MRGTRALGVALAAAIVLAVLAVGRARATPVAAERIARAERLLSLEEYERASRELEEVARAGSPALGDQDAIDFRRVACALAAARGQVEEFERHLEGGLVRARARTDLEAEARLLLAGALGAWQHADYGAADARLQAARALAGTLASDALAGQAAELQARVALKRGEYARARTHLAEAERRCAAAHDLGCLGRSAETGAAVALDRGEFLVARDGYERARALLLEAGDLHAANLDAARVAIVHLFQGADETGYELARGAAAEAQEYGLTAALAHALQVQGRAATALGLLDEAEQVLAASARLRARLGDRRQQAWVDAARAKAHAARGDSEAARAVLVPALASWRALDDRRALAWHLLERARLEVALGEAAAGASFSEAVALAQEIRLPYVPLLLADQARWLAGRGGDPAAALAAAQLAVETARASGNERLLWPALAARAAIARRLGQTGQALSDLGAAVGIERRLRAAGLGGDEAAVGAVERARDLYRDLAVLLVEDGRIEEGLLVRERGRELDLGPPTGARAPEVAASRGRSLDRLLRAARARRATLVSYLVGEEELLAWVVRPHGGVRLVRAAAGRARLEALIEQAQGRSGASRAEREAAREELARAVLAPLEPVLSGRDGELLILAPDGPLHRLGFAALPGGDGRLLVERARLELVPALVQHARPGARAPEPRTRRSALFADPATGRLPGEDVPLTRLPGARREATAVRELLGPEGVELALGAAATEARFRELAPGAALLHFAGHAVPRDDHPRASFLALAPTPSAAPGGPADGRLSVDEILELELAADLVVLSGCGSARGRATAAGTLSLARAFLAAGSHRVLATLWPVGDELAADLVDRFYAERARRGGDEAGALRAAQLALRDELQPGALRSVPAGAAADDPAQWAAFVLLGAPQ
ncbi:MAG: putative ATPase [Acidobacteria bacterium]|nr:putative ATPase [Acidobacteriota bacterium]